MTGAKMNFEEAMKKLEMIVEDLEKGEYSLEESLKKFEEGLELGKSCRKFLDEAEARVRMLVEEDGDRIAEKDVSDEF